MKINKDYSKVLRSGTQQTKLIDGYKYRKQIESAVILFWCMCGAGILIILALLFV